MPCHRGFDRFVFDFENTVTWLRARATPVSEYEYRNGPVPEHMTRLGGFVVDERTLYAYRTRTAAPVLYIIRGLIFEWSPSFFAEACRAFDRTSPYDEPLAALFTRMRQDTKHRKWLTMAWTIACYFEGEALEHPDTLFSL